MSSPSFIKTGPELAFQFRLFAYGRPGTFKTPLAATVYDLIKPERVLFADVDDGIMSVRGRMGDSRYVIAQPRSWNDLKDLIGWINEVQVGPTPFFALVLDSVSVAYEYAMKHILAVDAPARDEKRGGMSKRRGGYDTPELEDYQLCQARILKLMGLWLSFAPLVIVTAQEQEWQPDLESKPIIAPFIPGQLTSRIGRDFDIVGRMSTTRAGDGFNYEMLVAPRPNIVGTRDRSRLLGPTMTNPSLREMYNAFVTNHLVSALPEAVMAEPVLGE